MINIDFKTYGLNASFGARCFLTITINELVLTMAHVLMHLLALGAF